MSRSFHEPSDPFDIFERQAGEERRHRLEEARVRNAEFDAIEAAAAAERKEKARLFSLSVSKRKVAEQYIAAGVDPVQVDDEGHPTVSLSLLLSMGWTIGQQPDGFGEFHNVLIRPPSAPPRERKSRADYDQSS